MVVQVFLRIFIAQGAANLTRYSGCKITGLFWVKKRFQFQWFQSISKLKLPGYFCTFLNHHCKNGLPDFLLKAPTTASRLQTRLATHVWQSWSIPNIMNGWDSNHQTTGSLWHCFTNIIWDWFTENNPRHKSKAWSLLFGGELMVKKKNTTAESWGHSWRLIKEIVCNSGCASLSRHKSTSFKSRIDTLAQNSHCGLAFEGADLQRLAKKLQFLVYWQGSCRLSCEMTKEE